MTNEQIEKAAMLAACDYDNPDDEPCYDKNFYDGFIAGANYALSHQWVSVDERLPEDDVLVVVWTENSTILTDFCEKGKWHYYGVRYWLPIPPLNPKKEEK